MADGTAGDIPDDDPSIPTVTVHVPKLHAGQRRIHRSVLRSAWPRPRLIVVRCGRRWGKDVLMNRIAARAAMSGRKAGLFAPEHAQMIEPFDALSEWLAPMRLRSNRTEGIIRTTVGGSVDLWTLNDNELAGRGREYHDVLINEAAFTKGAMLDTWKKSIRPTLLTTLGRAWVFSTPKGVNPQNFFYQICHDPELEFIEFHAPTSDNPYIQQAELDRLSRTEHPLVFRQEYLAEFVDWRGVAFFSADKWMGDDGLPLPYPAHCDVVMAVIDTAVKSGQEHDGTAVLYVASNQGGMPGPRALLLDWDLIQIDGALLETWLPTVYQRLDQLAAECGARQGHIGVFIEDKASGTILIQQAQRRGWAVNAIDTTLTALGKDERALSVSGYHYQGLAKITQAAFDKTVSFKGSTQNHLITQITGFRIGDKDAHRRSDDLLDCYSYTLSITCGDGRGY